MKALLYTGLAMELVGMIAGGVYLGTLFEEHYQMEFAPLLGFMVGFGGWVVRILHIIKKEMREAEKLAEQEENANRKSVDN